MTDEAVRFMPGSLRMALEKHRESLLRGVLGPMTEEDGPEHHPPWTEGALDRKLVAEPEGLSAALGETTSFSALAEGFGRVAHFVLDAGFPPGMSDGDGAGRYTHFAQFCESRRGRFPLVFYGHDDPQLDGGDFHAFAIAVMRRARSEDRELARAYAAAGDPPNPAAFDDRSVPFAVGSLSYSRSITDVVRIWLQLWEQAGGDMAYTPYRNRTRSE
jgi:hypothetical protein